MAQEMFSEAQWSRVVAAVEGLSVSRTISAFKPDLERDPVPVGFDRRYAKPIMGPGPTGRVSFSVEVTGRVEEMAGQMRRALAALAEALEE